MYVSQHVYCVNNSCQACFTYSSVQLKHMHKTALKEDKGVFI